MILSCLGTWRLAATNQVGREDLELVAVLDEQAAHAQVIGDLVDVLVEQELVLLLVFVVEGPVRVAQGDLESIDLGDVGPEPAPAVLDRLERHVPHGPARGDVLGEPPQLVQALAVLAKRDVHRLPGLVEPGRQRVAVDPLPSPDLGDGGRQRVHVGVGQRVLGDGRGLGRDVGEPSVLVAVGDHQPHRPRSPG